MKKALSILLAVAMLLSLCACGGSNTNAPVSDPTSSVVEEESSQMPTIESIVEGIKYEFKDPDSVQLSNASFAYVKNGDEESKTEFYAIGTVRAKNSFGGYGDPQVLIIHCNNGRYKIIGEYTGESYAVQKKYNELGCGFAYSLR